MDKRELLAAADRNLAFTLAHFARTAPAATVEEDGGLLLVSTSATWPGPYHNAALRLDRSVSPFEVTSRAEAFFSGRCAGFCVWIAAHADADLEDVALDAGYASVSKTGSPRMVLEHPIASSEAPPGVVLGEVGDEAGRLDFLAVTVEAYAESFLPPDAAEATLASLPALCGEHVRAVVASEANEPKAAAMVVSSGQVASVQFVGTVPQARGRGLGELCTRWATRAGFELGAEAIVLEASEQGEPLYRRLGFTEQSRYRWCLGPPPT
jgi:ribosomal protein S18 acetylase RimI-like enzyme